MDRDLEGKTAVVTGGGSGIGRAVATQLADAGMHVVVADIQQDALDATQAGAPTSKAPRVSWRVSPLARSRR